MADDRQKRLMVYLDDRLLERFETARKAQTRDNTLSISRSEFGRKLIRDGLDQMEDTDTGGDS